MKKLVSLISVLVASAFICGCCEKVNENKTPAEAKAEAAQLDAKQLEAKIADCKKFIEAKKADAEAVAKKIADIPLKEKLGAESKKLSAEASKIGDSIKNVSAQLDEYVKALEAKKAAK
ncbi:MAG: hypothetical protein IKO42_02295 [Opitutales bacterium]|nr:hypothetical protein [Opitutales bacterium]